MDANLCYIGVPILRVTRCRMLSQRSFAICFALCASSLLIATCSFGQSFKNPSLIPTSSQVLAMAAADLTGNGKTDIVYVDGSSSAAPALHVLMGNGDGTFSHGQ